MTKSPPRDVTRVGMSPQPSPKGKSIFTAGVWPDSGASRLDLGSGAAVKGVTQGHCCLASHPSSRSLLVCKVEIMLIHSTSLQ